jgi:hypothetical protein
MQSNNNPLESIVMSRIRELGEKKEIISFPRVFSKICVTFSIKKSTAWEVIRYLKEIHLVEIVPFHGIKIVK